MFALRRIAARAVAQPLRFASIIPTTSRISYLQPKPALQRLFHQSWLRYSEEDTGVQSSETTQNSFASGSQQQEQRKILYVGNLFFNVTASDLEAEFSRFGTITNVRVVADSRGVSKGFGFVEFADTADAEKALQATAQTTFQGRPMNVQFHTPRDPIAARTGRGVGLFRERQPNSPSKTLFIGNMSFQMTDKDLNDLFKEIRNVLDVRVAIDRRSGQPRGFAHADFTDVESAERAKEVLENKVVYGRTLRIDFSQDSDRSGGARGA